MLRKRTEGLTDREAEIMAVLWQMGQASVEDIRQRLEGRPAASTVRSLLVIMAERGLVADDNTVYAKKYRPKLDQSQAQDSALRRVIDRLFSGSTEELLVRLIDEGAVDSAQLERLQKRGNAATKANDTMEAEKPRTVGHTLKPKLEKRKI